MGGWSWSRKDIDDSGDSIFADNPFLDDLLQWRHSPEGQEFAEFAHTLCGLMEQVHLDTRKRLLIWPDGKQLELDPSVAYVRTLYPDYRPDWIEEYLLDWIEMDYTPEHYSDAQLEELDKLSIQWVADHLRRARTAKKRRKTRHS